MEHSSFDATISALDAETSALGAATSAIARRSFDVMISALDAETSAIARSYRRYRRGDCGGVVTLQMCNRVINHGDMGTFSQPVLTVLTETSPADPIIIIFFNNIIVVALSRLKKCQIF